MKKYFLISAAILAIIAITGCDIHELNHTIYGTGDVVSMTVDVPAFTGVNVIGTCNVNITIGETQHVKLNAQQEVLDVMTYEVIAGILQISFEPDVTVDTDEEISADITIPSLSFVSVTGAGNFDLTGEKQESLEINIIGSGNVNAYGMNVDACSIDISGVGECRVWVNNTLDVIVSGVGIIYFRGDPEITYIISGVGSIHEDNI